MAMVLLLVVGLSALFWGALNDRLKMLAVCVCLVVAMMCVIHAMHNSLTPQQKAELELRVQEQKQIEAEIEAEIAKIRK